MFVHIFMNLYLIFTNYTQYSSRHFEKLMAYVALKSSDVQLLDRE